MKNVTNGNLWEECGTVTGYVPCHRRSSHLLRGSNHAVQFNCILLSSERVKVKVKVIPRQAEVAQGVAGSLRPRIFLTFGTTRVVGRQPHAPANFTPGEIPGMSTRDFSWG